MRVDRGAAKKLIVAFHFQSANQSGWKCDTCRKNGLERKRRCGFIRDQMDGQPVVVWAHRNVAVAECPKSYITSASTTFLEQYAASKYFGVADMYALPAPTVDAICTIEREVQEEKKYASR